MKQTKIALAFTLIAGLAAAGSAIAETNGGTITFTGAVSDATCTVSGGSGTDGGSGNFSVSLDPVEATALATAGATANEKAFDVVIGGPGQGTCTDGKVATMSFLTTDRLVDPTTGALMNALSGEATMTQIQLKDAVGVVNLADLAYSVDSPDVVNNTAIIPFSAQYLATGAATAGLVSTHVVYKVVYN
jgi:major type 1 subunit fimbrin (pilin)